MSLLTMVQGVADKIGVARPAYIIANADQTVRRLLALANEEGDALARYPHPKGGWAAQQKIYNFTTVAGQEEYNLPNDFLSFIDNTMWDKTGRRPVNFPINPALWAEVKAGDITQLVGKQGRVMRSATSGNNVLLLSPLPASSGEIVSLEYRSSYWCKALDGSLSNNFVADSDVSLLPEFLLALGLRWRFLRDVGMDYGAHYQEYSNVLRQELARDGGMVSRNLAKNSAVEHGIGYQHITDGGWA
ncbi:MAG: hypothetical protein ACOYK8_00495 [Alphaproteobacteria bacterium]